MVVYLEQVLVLISTPVYVVLILTEMALSYWRGHGKYTATDTATNIYLMLLNSGVDLLFRAVYLVILTFFYQYHFMRVEPAWAYWLLLFLLEDFLFYVLHAVDHFSRFFWAVHVTHHSSEHFNLTTGFRSSVFQPLYRFVYFIPLVFLGFAPSDVVVMYAATQIYGVIVHTSYVKKLGVLEHILVTPSHHRVHHASNVEYLDKNMGMCLIIWDKLFGTFQEELDEVPVKYGLTSPLPNRGPFHIVFHEWLNIWKDLSKGGGLITKMKYIFAAPGWSHDGSSKTSEQLRAEKKTSLNSHHL